MALAESVAETGRQLYPLEVASSETAEATGPTIRHIAAGRLIVIEPQQTGSVATRAAIRSPNVKRAPAKEYPSRAETWPAIVATVSATAAGAWVTEGASEIVAALALAGPIGSEAAMSLVVVAGTAVASAEAPEDSMDRALIVAAVAVRPALDLEAEEAPAAAVVGLEVVAAAAGVGSPIFIAKQEVKERNI